MTLDMNLGLDKPMNPFKLNLGCVEHPSLMEKIRESWVSYNLNLGSSPSIQFQEKLKRSKETISILAAEKIYWDEKLVYEEEKRFWAFLANTDHSTFSEEHKKSLKSLEEKKKWKFFLIRKMSGG